MLQYPFQAVDDLARRLFSWATRTTYTELEEDESAEDNSAGDDVERAELGVDESGGEEVEGESRGVFEFGVVDPELLALDDARRGKRNSSL